MATLTIGSCFSGIAGIEIGLEFLGLGPVLWQCDSDPCARAVLAAHYPGVRLYEDVREIDARAARVSLLCGGPPCQGHSVAGKRKGTADPRWLWPEFARVIGALRPGLVFIENVPGLRTSGLRDVLADLAALGFDAEWGMFTAAEVGAPHIRRRLFILAYANGTVLREQPGRRSGARGAREAEPAVDGSNGDVAHANGEGQLQQGGALSAERGRAGNGSGEAVADSDGLRLLRWAHDKATARATGGDAAQGDHPWSAESGLGDLVDGLSRWLGEHGGLNEQAARRTAEALRAMWNGHVAQAVRETAGRLGPVDASALLFSLLCEHEGRPDQERVLPKGKTTSGSLLRSLRLDAVSPGPPLRPKSQQQRTEKRSDALRELSRVVAPRGASPWDLPGWEGGVPRIAYGVPGRTERLRLAGNSCVPQQAALAFRDLAARAL